MKYHKKLLNVVIILAILAGSQLIDYMLAGQKIFKTISGTVTDVKKSIDFGTSKRTRNIYYTKTVIRIGDKMKRFYAKTQTDADSLLQQLQQGDSVFLFTDGFADQFGGPRGKKFKYKQLSDILMTIHKKTVKEQEHLLAMYFEEWMGTHEQVDDVCIIGIRL